MAASDNLQPGLFDASHFATPPQAPSAAPGSSTPAISSYALRGRGGKQPAWARDQHLDENEQLPAFMTANEIMAKYQPLDADRQGGRSGWGGDSTQRSYQSSGYESSGSYDPRAGSKTARPKVTDTYGREHNDPRGTGKYDTTQTARSDQPGGEPMHPYIRANAREGQFHSGQWHSAVPGASDEPETSSELWDRKYDESVHDKTVKMKVGGSDDFSTGGWSGRGGTESLAASINKHGVEYPIRLGETIGQEGMPEVVGGHHRLAVMFHDRPDDLMPVLHDHSIRTARDEDYEFSKSGKGYPYK